VLALVVRQRFRPSRLKYQRLSFVVLLGKDGSDGSSILSGG
jgi:hypothetical protein